MLKQCPGAFVVLVPDAVIMPPLSGHNHLGPAFPAAASEQVHRVLAKTLVQHGAGMDE